MRVYVDGNEVTLVPGMTVRHALVAAGLLTEISRGMLVRDAWGNVTGLEGALSEGDRLYVRTAPPLRPGDTSGT